MNYTPEQLEAEIDRLRFQWGGWCWQAKLELLWLRLKNKDHHELTSDAWRELRARTSQ